MASASYDTRRGELTTYFDRTAVEAWSRLTSDAPVSRIRATVRAGRDAMRATLLSWLPADMTGLRLLDAGWSIWYSADLPVFHPRTTPSRHRGYAVLTARNRFWMAWRSLPVLLMLPIDVSRCSESPKIAFACLASSSSGGSSSPTVNR